MDRAKPLSVALVILSPMLAFASVPVATCRPTDRPETGMSGETTQAERDSGAAFHGFKCNADLVGQYQGEGASWQLTAWKNCAYFDQRHPGATGSSGESHPGVVVVDVSDPTQPVPTTWLDASAMIDPWESVKVNPARQLLGGGQRPLNATSPGDGFSVYDIAADCKAPVLKSDVHIPGSFGHSGQWAPDGKTYYITPLRNSPSIIAVDVTDPANPAGIPGGLITFNLLDGGTPGPQDLPLSRLHDLEFSKDGNTAYITMFGIGTTNTGNGIALLDVSDFQNRVANPEYRVKSFLTWDDGSIGAQNALPVTIAGKSYIITTDEAGVGFFGAAGCDLGESANGFPRIIDISDPIHPTTVSKIQLGVADPANCAAINTAPITGSTTTLPDGGVLVTTGPGFFAHSCHYCRVDDADNAKILACNCFAAGLRIFDIHDPLNPKEMAYFKPPAQGRRAFPASQYANSNSTPGFVRNYDWATSQPSFPKDRGVTFGDIWTTSQDNGFMVVRLYSTVTVSPSTASIETGKTATFNAAVDGAVKTAGVTWSVQEASGGTVSSSGVFTGTTPGTYHVIATSILDGTKSDTAVVTVTATPAPTDTGCSAAPGTFSALVLGVLTWVFWRRKRQAE